MLRRYNSVFHFPQGFRAKGERGFWIWKNGLVFLVHFDNSDWFEHLARRSVVWFPRVVLCGRTFHNASGADIIPLLRSHLLSEPPPLLASIPLSHIWLFGWLFNNKYLGAFDTSPVHSSVFVCRRNLHFSIFWTPRTSNLDPQRCCCCD